MFLCVSYAMFLSLSILYFGYDFNNKYNNKYKYIVLPISYTSTGLRSGASSKWKIYVRFQRLKYRIASLLVSN